MNISIDDPGRIDSKGWQEATLPAKHRRFSRRKKLGLPEMYLKLKEHDLLPLGYLGRSSKKERMIINGEPTTIELDGPQ